MIGFTGGRLTTSGKRSGRGTDFGGLARYLLYGDRSPQQGPRAVWTATRNLVTEDLEEAARIMTFQAELAPRTKEPVFHFGVSLGADEKLSREQWEQVADRLLGALLEQRRGHVRDPREHQAVLALHDDGRRQHLHIMLNRVGPDGGVWEGSWNFPKVERELRTLERELGLVHVQGRHFAFEQEERFRGARQGPTEGEQRLARETGTKAWTEALLEARGDLLREHLRAARGWRELEQRLDGLGLELRPSGRGGIVLTDGHASHRLKLSRVDRASSGPALEQRFGQSYKEWRAEQQLALQTLTEQLERLPLRVASFTADGRGSAGLRDHERLAFQAARFSALVATAYADGHSAESLVANDVRSHGSLWHSLRLLQHEPEKLGRILDAGALTTAIAAGQELERTRQRAASHAFWREADHAFGGEVARLRTALRDAGPRQALRTLHERPDMYGTVTDREALTRLRAIGAGLERPWTVDGFWRALRHAYAASGGDGQARVAADALRQSLSEHGISRTVTRLQADPGQFGRVRDATAIATTIARGLELSSQRGTSAEIAHSPRLGLAAARTARQMLRTFGAVHGLAQGQEVTAAAPRLVTLAPDLAASLVRLAPHGRSFGDALRLPLRSLEQIGVALHEGRSPTDIRAHLQSARSLLGLAQTVGARALALALPASALASLNIAVKPLALGLTIGARIITSIAELEQSRGLHL